MDLRLLDCQRKLALLWSIGAIVPFVILVGQTTIGNAFSSPEGDFSINAWEWFLPTLMPTLGLVFGVMANNEIQPTAKQEAQHRRVSSFFFRLALAVSAFYVLLVCAMLIFTYAVGSIDGRLKLLTKSHLFLAPLQALANIVLGVFFISSKKPE